MVSPSNTSSPHTLADIMLKSAKSVIVFETGLTPNKEKPMKTRSIQLNPVYVNILQPKPGEALPFRVYERVADATSAMDTTIIHRALRGVVVVNMPIVTKVEITEAEVDKIFDAWSTVDKDSRNMNLREFFKMKAFGGGPESLSKVQGPPDDEC